MLRTLSRLRWGTLALVPMALVARPAASEPSAAEHLFGEARKLMAEGRYAEACPKLAESQRRDPQGGTILNLALCHEVQGRFASAQSELREALAMARRDGKHDREKLASEFLTAVQGKVSYLTFRTSEASDASEVVIQIDDAELARPDWQTRVPVDPGVHRIVFRAEGKEPETRTIRVGAVADSQVVSVPVLLDRSAPIAPRDARTESPTAPIAPRDARTESPTAPTDTSADPPSGGHPGFEPPSRPPNLRAAGLVLLLGSLIGIGGGTALGLEALSKRRASDAYCSGGSCFDQRGVDLNVDARRLALYADLAVGAALVAGGVGAYLTLSGGSPATPGSTSASATTGRRGEPLQVISRLTPGGGSLSLAGAW